MSDAPRKQDNRKVAFSLGGLAGNNAHGAGALQAAMDADLSPDLIACTSGQIFWTHQYLTVRETGGRLEDILTEEIEKTAPTKNINLDWEILRLMGRRGVFRPAYSDFFMDFYRNILRTLERVAARPGESHLAEAFWDTLPARILTPEFPEAFFTDVSDAFNRSPVGVMFNTYSPKEGLEYVHLNPAARKMLKVRFEEKNRYRDQTLYKPITPEYVKGGLWIFQYGFDGTTKIFDGAYFRQIILSELVPAHTIFVARPINSRWIGEIPSSFIGVEDLKTETAFNGSYAGEKDKIRLINKLIREGAFKEDKYHAVDLVEIEVKSQEGFFDYVFEKKSLFDAARKDAYAKFVKYKKGRKGADGGRA